MNNTHQKISLSVTDDMRQGYWLGILFGPMWGGKTENLDQLLAQFKKQGKNVMKIIHRYDSTVENRKEVVNPFNRDGILLPSYYDELNEDTVINKDVQVIGIDEGQFFNIKIIDFVIKHINLGKTIIICSLDGTFEQKKMGYIDELIRHSNFTIKLNAICDICGDPAPFTIKRSNPKQIIEIGGKDLYNAVCRKHIVHIQ
jgi:thymidine kinase